MTTIIERNIEKMKKAQASDTEIDQYLIAEKEQENCFPRIWRKPLVATPALTPAEARLLQGKYGLEVSGHWQDKLALEA